MWSQQDERLLDKEGRPTSQWAGGSRVLGHYELRLRPGTPPGTYRLRVGVYRLADLQPLRIIDEEDLPVGTEYILSRVRVADATFPPSPGEFDIQHLLGEDLNGRIRLVGANIGEGVVRSGATLHFELFWQALAPLQVDYQLLIRLQDEQGHTLEMIRVPPSRESYPTSAWPQGDITRYRQTVDITPEAAGGSYALMVNLVETGTGQRLAPQDVRVADITVRARERLFEIPEMMYAGRAAFGDDIEFLGFDLREESVSTGGSFDLVLYWRALRPTSIPYTVFTHLLDEEGKLRGQHDGVPGEGMRPTTGWAVGEIVADPHEIVVDRDAPQGSYVVEIGFYDPVTGDRMPALDEEGQPLEHDRVLLPNSIEVIAGAQS
jgi:hypothetical protein